MENDIEALLQRLFHFRHYRCEMVDDCCEETWQYLDALKKASVSCDTPPGSSGKPMRARQGSNKKDGRWNDDNKFTRHLCNLPRQSLFSQIPSPLSFFSLPFLLPSSFSLLPFPCLFLFFCGSNRCTFNKQFARKRLGVKALKLSSKSDQDHHRII